MQRVRHIPRRSFLAQVAGGGLIIGAGLIVGADARAAQQSGEPSTRQMGVDADPSDPARLPPPPARPADRDSGPNSDPHGAGRQTSSSMPSERFVICPGNTRCPH